MNITILLPIHGSARSGFTACVANLVSHTVQAAGATVTTHEVDLPLTVARNHLLDLALRRRADYALMLDYDHIFPSDALLRLLAHKKEAVGLNQPRRQKEIMPTAVRNGQFVQTTAESAGIEEVDSIGLAVFLLDMKVLPKLQRYADEQKTELWPLFKDDWTPGPTYTEGDRYFCGRLREAGIPIYIDQDLSRETSHITEIRQRFT